MPKFSHRFRPRGQNFGLGLGLGLEGLVFLDITDRRQKGRQTNGWSDTRS